MLRSRRHLFLSLAMLALMALSLAVAGCGSAESQGKGTPEEGDPVEVGPLSITVLSSRYLDKTDKEDAAYLAGQPPVGAGLRWLGVFVEMQNEGERGKRVPSMTIEDSSEKWTYSAFPSDNPDAVTFGEVIGPGERIPRPDTTDEESDEGAFLIFRVGRVALRNKPLTLHIEGFFGKAAVKLDF
jgi:hypothetical protein